MTTQLSNHHVNEGDDSAIDTLRRHNQRASTPMENVLKTCGAEDLPIGDDLRQAMVPRMARDLVRMHTDTGDWLCQHGLFTESCFYFSKAMQVSDLVANEEGRLYQWFETMDMDRFLNQIRQAGIKLLEAGSYRFKSDSTEEQHDTTHRLHIYSGQNNNMNTNEMDQNGGGMF